MKYFFRKQKIQSKITDGYWWECHAAAAAQNFHQKLIHATNHLQPELKALHRQGVQLNWAPTATNTLNTAGVNIFQNSPRKIGEKFPNFLGSGEEFDEIQFQAYCYNLELGREGNFPECKDEYYPIKSYCFPWWSGIKCKLSKNVAIYT